MHKSKNTSSEVIQTYFVDWKICTTILHITNCALKRNYIYRKFIFVVNIVLYSQQGLSDKEKNALNFPFDFFFLFSLLASDRPVENGGLKGPS